MKLDFRRRVALDHRERQFPHRHRAGNFQSEIGCAGDWQPDCLRSWLQDIDGDGIYEYFATGIPAVEYEVKAALGEARDENHGAGGS